MAGTTVFILRYANAFASVAASTHLDVTAAQQQMKDFASILAESHELREVLMNPSIAADQKLAVVDGLAERMGMMREVRNFIAVIMDHQRLNQLDEIIAEYLRVADTSAGLTDAEVTSAHPLDDANRAELESQITRLAGSRVRIAYHLDASLLGGAVVKIGSTVYDGSVRMQLQQMKETLTRA